jgi:molybdopterin-guanine dinucleotide biosynthesis protein B
MPPMISIVGKSGSGKTTFIEKLIPALKRRNLRVGVIKHAHHGFEIDREGKDSWRHKQAGADAVLISSPGAIAMVRDQASESLDSLEPFLQGLDLVITEGFKREGKPKIEVFRAGFNGEPICAGDPSLVALVTDMEADLGVPRFGLEEVEAVIDFIERNFL